MINLVRTNAQNKDFIKLVKILDSYLTITDGDEHDFYHQYNHLDDIKYVVMAYEAGEALGCGAIKSFDNETMEVKRMFVHEKERGKGIAGKLLGELERWAQELGYTRCILETGLRQTAAVRFYKKSGYQKIDNYAQYIGVDNSVCMEKRFNK